MKPYKANKEIEKEYFNKKISCYVRDWKNELGGPFIGYVQGFQSNEVDIEKEGGEFYSLTGLLVKIPELGNNKMYIDWPVRFSDATIIN